MSMMPMDAIFVDVNQSTLSVISHHDRKSPASKRTYLNIAADLMSVCVTPQNSGTSTNVHASITRNLPLFSARELEL